MYAKFEIRISSHSISIHAPHARSDVRLLPSKTSQSLFQSTLLMRGATDMLSKPQFWHVHFNPRSSCEERHVGKRRAVIRDVISIHAPHGGATIPIIAAARLCNSISIHAPHARSDSTACGSTGTIPHFNPRSSCEERLEVAIPRGIDDAFQSTLLMRGATPCTRTRRSKDCYFNPRSSCEERLACP